MPEVSLERMALIQSIIKKEEHYREGNRRRANKYYHKHFKINENMNEEEIKNVKKNIEEKRKKEQDKYMNNREFYIKRQQQYRKNKEERLRREAEENNKA